jgi:hypothetical protein
MRKLGITWRIGLIVFAGAVVLALTAGTAFAAQGNSNGAAGQMPAFYEGRQVTVNMFEVPAAEGSLLDRNANVNTIYGRTIWTRNRIAFP